jgi:hypothetical protein
MQGSRILRALFSTVCLGVLALAPSGCSHENGGFTSPGDGFPAAGVDDSAPAMPTGLMLAKATDHAFRLEWAPNTEVDLAGYRFYVYDPSPYRENAYVCASGTELIQPENRWYVYSADLSQGQHFFKLSAVDQTGNESVRCGPLPCSYSPDTENGTISTNEGDGTLFDPPAGDWGDNPDGWRIGSTLDRDDRR